MRFLVLSLALLMPLGLAADSPASRAFISDNLKTARNQVCSIQLNDGRILIAGGLGRSMFQGDQKMQTLAKAEILDPITGLTHSIAPLNIDRAAAFLFKMDDGRVLVFGGYTITKGGTYQGAGSSEIFDPSTQTFTLIKGLDSYNSSDSDDAILLPGGKVLYASSVGIGILDLATGIWKKLAPYVYQRGNVRMVVLPDGKVIVAGPVATFINQPEGNWTIELFDPATGAFEAIQTNVFRSNQAEMCVMPDGRVAIIGGDSFCRQIAIFDPETKVAYNTGTLFNYHFNPSVMITNGTAGTHIAVFEGFSAPSSPGSNLSSSIELIDLNGTCNSSFALQDPPIGRAGLGVARGNGNLFLFGGTDNRCVEAVPEAYF